MNRAKLIENLEAHCKEILTTWAFDPVLREKFRRVRSIIRRLKRCPVCMGKGLSIIETFDFGFGPGSKRWACSRCNGTGRIA